MIKQREEQLEELRLLAMCNKAIAYDSVKVQSSKTDGLPAADRYLDQAFRLKRLVDEYVHLEDEIIGQIQGMRDHRYMLFLYLRFVKGFRMKEIAKKMEYSEDHVYELQRKAIRAFGSKYADKIKVNRKSQVDTWYNDNVES